MLVLIDDLAQLKESHVASALGDVRRLHIFTCGEVGEENPHVGEFEVIPEVESRDTTSDDFVFQYIDAIGACAEQNHDDPLWWLTAVASKNRFNSSLPECLFLFSQIISTLEGVSPEHGHVVVVSPSSGLVAGLLQNCERTGHEPLDLLRMGHGLFHRIKTRLQSVRTLSEEALRLTWRIFLARIHYGGLPRNRASEIYVIKSFVYPNSFADDGTYHDPFFGNLAQFLRRTLPQNHDVMTVAFGFSEFGHIFKRMKALKRERVAPFEAFVSVAEVWLGALHLLWPALFGVGHLTHRVEFIGHDVRDLLNAHLRDSGNQIQLTQYLHLACARNLMKRNAINTCAMTYEGNPWERMWIKGLRDNGDLNVLGYQHSVVTQASAGMFQSHRENGIMPVPDTILTTGDAPARTIQRYSAFPKEWIKPACALRYSYLDDASQFSERRKNPRRQVLVALEGVVEVVDLLKYALSQASKCPDIVFRIRTHPVLPISRILALLGTLDEDLPSNVEVSKNVSIEEDISNCDALLYWGTTVSVEAIAMGKPVIHYSRGDLLSYDPLFEFHAFKWTVDSTVDLPVVLAEIFELSDDSYLEGQMSARSFVKEYFKAVDDKSMMAFLPGTNEGMH